MLPAGYRTGLTHRWASDLYEAVPAVEHHHKRAVRELRDVLAL
ncbi:hypothetical protein OIE69_42810 [Actinacidiphila glaucinigra]|nr:hypothetical protein [Actinacidiphila glaucinigra]WSD57523.1 hypothetical protein OIE69_00410 [Actinacidiphila glaucinigra]WSD65122.1 hypothetical protein OIE69_42810 [Actinacidiphila glaucinigra]